MQLLIDIGNTATKCSWDLAPASRAPAQPLAVYRCPSDADSAAIVAFLNDVLRAAAPTVTAAWAVCVASDAVYARWATAIEQVLVCSVQRLRGDTSLVGMRNGYDKPALLGADRWVAAYGAAEIAHTVRVQGADIQGEGVPRDCVLATFGTATTVDLIRWDAASQHSVFEGGLIFPGVQTAWRSLATATAQLPDLSAETQTTSPPTQLHAVAKNTHNAIVQGLVHSQRGAIMSAMSAWGSNLQLFVAGGAAGLIAPHLNDLQPTRLDQAVLLGLQRYVSQQSPIHPPCVGLRSI